MKLQTQIASLRVGEHDELELRRCLQVVQFVFSRAVGDEAVLGQSNHERI
jgi:hypothetical protein